MSRPAVAFRAPAASPSCVGLAGRALATPSPEASRELAGNRWRPTLARASRGDECSVSVCEATDRTSEDRVTGYSCSARSWLAPSSHWPEPPADPPQAHFRCRNASAPSPELLLREDLDCVCNSPVNGAFLHRFAARCRSQLPPAWQAV